MVDIEEVKRKFRARYHCEPRLFRAAGRVNLIGEHTDYNGGFVLPMAIERETIVAVAARHDRIIRVYSENAGESETFDLDQIAEFEKLRGFWLGYVEGVARVLDADESKLRGADLLIVSDVPTGAGLSSSAALEISTALALTTISEKPLNSIALALAGQQAEHEFVGAKVGIMDQFISAMGKKDHALLIDCRHLTSELVPLVSDKTAIVIVDSGVKHSLATSEYNKRRAECEKGVELLKPLLPQITQLRDVSLSDFEKYNYVLPETIKMRCRHIITENARTLQAASALKQNDYKEFGQLMNESHTSLRDDFQISCKELDLLVEIAGKHREVLGARMTGGGFGGSTVHLIERTDLTRTVSEIASVYKSKTGIEPTVLISKAADGAKEM